MHGIGGVLVRVDATEQANRVLVDEAPNGGIVITEAVIVQARFHIIILALKTQRVGDAFNAEISDAFCAVICLPRDITVLIG
ncbi:hypothetical protein L4D12_00425 [Photobacterium nomapromontoriensis]